MISVKQHDLHVGCCLHTDNYVLLCISNLANRLYTENTAHLVRLCLTLGSLSCPYCILICYDGLLNVQDGQRLHC